MLFVWENVVVLVLPKDGTEMVRRMKKHLNCMHNNQPNKNFYFLSTIAYMLLFSFDFLAIVAGNNVDCVLFCLYALSNDSIMRTTHSINVCGFQIYFFLVVICRC